MVVELEIVLPFSGSIKKYPIAQYQEVIIGRDPSCCTIVLPSEDTIPPNNTDITTPKKIPLYGVHRQHIKIIKSDNQWYVITLRKPNSDTRISQQDKINPISPNVSLQDGDTILLGNFDTKKPVSGVDDANISLLSTKIIFHTNVPSYPPIPVTQYTSDNFVNLFICVKNLRQQIRQDAERNSSDPSQQLVTQRVQQWVTKLVAYLKQYNIAISLSRVNTFPANANSNNTTRIYELGGGNYLQVQSNQALSDEIDGLMGDFSDSIKIAYQTDNVAPDMIGSSLCEIRRLISKFAPFDIPVIILGETGTGKELVAKAIHDNSPRKEMPFISENCAAIPNTLIEAELFGTMPGGFSGAKDRAGLFEQAHGGTIFLDEIGDMSPAMQAKLLRVLQEKKLRRVGGIEDISVDVRIISATNKNIADPKIFREDLYYRLNVFSIELAPLRERQKDISVLANHFLQKACCDCKIPQKTFSQKALDILKKYAWPGNIRELETSCKRMAITAKNSIIGEADVATLLEYDLCVESGLLNILNVLNGLNPINEKVYSEAIHKTASPRYDLEKLKYWGWLVPQKEGGYIKGSSFGLYYRITYQCDVCKKIVDTLNFAISRSLTLEAIKKDQDIFSFMKSSLPTCSSCKKHPLKIVKIVEVDGLKKTEKTVFSLHDSPQILGEQSCT